MCVSPNQQISEAQHILDFVAKRLETFLQSVDLSSHDAPRVGRTSAFAPHGIHDVSLADTGWPPTQQCVQDDSLIGREHDGSPACHRTIAGEINADPRPARQFLFACRTAAHSPILHVCVQPGNSQSSFGRTSSRAMIFLASVALMYPP